MVVSEASYSRLFMAPTLVTMSRLSRIVLPLLMDTLSLFLFTIIIFYVSICVLCLPKNGTLRLPHVITFLTDEAKKVDAQCSDFLTQLHHRMLRSKGESQPTIVRSSSRISIPDADVTAHSDDSHGDDSDVPPSAPTPPTKIMNPEDFLNHTSIVGKIEKHRNKCASPHPAHIKFRILVEGEREALERVNDEIESTGSDDFIVWKYKDI